MASPSKPLICVQVRELVEFALRRGDLGGERDFVGPNRALEGIRGHQRLQRSRPPGYQKEVRVVYDLPDAEFILRIQGRIDGLLADGTEVLIEEIKTIQGAHSVQADDLHWAQAKLYGFIYSHDHHRGPVTLRLAYVHLVSGEVTEFLERLSFVELSAFFQEAIAVYLEWMREQQRWRQLRDASIRSIGFPFPAYRPGQREIAVAIYRAVSRERRLFVEAPTGIGKTISVLFPTLKAMAEGKLERIFYLTARTTARTVAEKALSDLRRAGLRVRSLTLTAKEKICVGDGQACDPASCSLAQGYYDRRHAAMRAALARDEITRSVLEEIGQRHQVCPFELSLDLSMWVDAVICDYNYAFDPKAYLRRHFADENGEHVLLIDEAHNLVDRAREMFSAQISTSRLLEVQKSIQASVPSCAKALRKLVATVRKLGGPAAPEKGPSPPEDGALSLFETPCRPVSESIVSFPPLAATDLLCRGDTQVLAAFPNELATPLSDAIEEAERWLVRNEPAGFRPELLTLYFELSFFSRIAERYDEHYRTILSSGRDPMLDLFCLDPSVLLGQVLARAKAVVLFSATLSPMEYYRDLLGGRPDDPLLRLPSPFPPDRLAVLVHDRIRTQFKSRGETLGGAVGAIAALVRAHRGNYMVYLPSYRYLEDLRDLFERLCPDVSILSQRPGMTDAEREVFLGAFTTDSTETRVGFAVMGGVFGEGVDLVGDQLIGAVIVGVGLPQLSVERDLMRQYFQGKIGAGFEYAYAFPGMNRVLQATGRVIRSETDRGAVMLIDARFGEARYRRLFPSWWRAVRVRNVEEIRGALDAFWKDGNSEP